jgi:transposase
MNKINSNFEGQTIFVGMDVHKSSWNPNMIFHKIKS